MSPLTSESRASQVSSSMSEMRRFSFAGSCILFWALRKMVPSIPVSEPRASRVWRYWISRSSPSLPLRSSQP